MQTYVPPLGIFVFAALIFVGGILLRRWIGKRRFERTNEAGVQEFASYDRMRLAQSTEGCLGCIGLLAVLAGFVLGVLWLVARFSSS